MAGSWRRKIGMTDMLHRDDAYLTQCDATVTGTGDNTICLDRSVFYALGGGQPGDTGRIEWDGTSVRIIDTRYGDSGDVNHVTEDGASLPAGCSRRQVLRRRRDARRSPRL